MSVRGEIRKPSYNSQQAQRRFQQINDLISFRQKLKSALILSNATTKVKICGREMTIAEVIEEKNAIKHKQELLRRLKDQYSRCVSEVENVNQNLRRKLENETTNKNDKDDKTTIEEYQRGYFFVFTGKQLKNVHPKTLSNDGTSTFVVALDSDKN